LLDPDVDDPDDPEPPALVPPVSAVPVVGEDGRLGWIIHRVEDVTEFVHLHRRDVESEALTGELQARPLKMEAEILRRSAQLQEANNRNIALVERLQKLDQLKSSFVAIAAHELRTPAALIYGVSQTLQHRAAELSAVQLEQLRLAEGELADRGQHPGGYARRPGGWAGALDHGNTESAARRPPGAGEADDAASDDHRVITPIRGTAAHTCLRRHYPDQVQTVGGLDAALSASAPKRQRLPLLLRCYPSRPAVKP